MRAYYCILVIVIRSFGLKVVVYERLALWYLSRPRRMGCCIITNCAGDVRSGQSPDAKKTFAPSLVDIDYDVDGENQRLNILTAICCWKAGTGRKVALKSDFSGLITRFLSGKRDSDPRPLVWETNALPTELFPLVC